MLSLAKFSMLSFLRFIKWTAVSTLHIAKVVVTWLVVENILHSHLFCVRVNIKIWGSFMCGLLVLETSSSKLIAGSSSILASVPIFVVNSQVRARARARACACVCV